MSIGAIHSLVHPTSQPARDAEQATLLGLYHGYDQARLALARVVCQLGSETSTDAATRRQIWSRVHRSGICPDLFQSPHTPDLPGVRDGAHSAALAAFATVSEKAEELLTELRERWPELREDAGGPLPAPSPDWLLD